MLVADDVDRRIIAELQINGRASWTEIANRASMSVAAVARRGQQLFARGAVRVGVMPNWRGQEPGQLHDIRIQCAPGTQIDVASRLVDLAELRFLALVTGQFDLIGELAVLPDMELHLRVINAVQEIPGVQRCVTNPHMHAYKVSQRWLRQTLGDDVPENVEEPGPCDPSHADDIDRRIVDAMATNGRISMRSLAEQLQLNETTVRRRFDTLAESGCVRVVTLVSALAVGYEAETLLDVHVDPTKIDTVAAKLAGYDGVRYIAASLSSPSLFCEMILPDANRVHEFFTSELARMDGVRGWDAGTELLTFKRGFIETPWWRDAVQQPDGPTAAPSGIAHDQGS